MFWRKKIISFLFFDANCRKKVTVINNSTAFKHESSRYDIRVGQNVIRWTVFMLNIAKVSLSKDVFLALFWKCFITFLKFWTKSVTSCIFIAFELASRFKEPSTAWATHRMVAVNKPNSFDSLSPAEIFVEQPSALMTTGQSGISNATILFSSSWKRSLQALKYSGDFSGEKPQFLGQPVTKFHEMHYYGMVRDG